MKKIKLPALAFVFLIGSLTGTAQSITITGTVKDAVSKQPLSGVSVYIRGSKGVSTDSLGVYSIVTSRESIPLVFSIIDYRDQTIIVKKSENRAIKTMDVFLDP